MTKRKIEEFDKTIKKQKIANKEDVIKEVISSIKNYINTSNYVSIGNLPQLLENYNKNFSEDIILYTLKGIEVSDYPRKYVNIVRCLLHHDVLFSDDTYNNIYGSYEYYKEFRSVFGHSGNTITLSNCFKTILEMMTIINNNNNIDLSFVKINKNLQQIIKNYSKTPVYDEDRYYWSWGVRCYKMDDYE